MSVFREKYVKTDKIEVEYSKIYGKAFESRNESDYERSEFPSKTDAENALDGAKRFVERIERFLKESKSK